MAWLLDRGEPERHIGRSWRAYAGTEEPIELCVGYNLVGYFPDSPLPVADALASIDGLYSSVLGFDPDEGAQSFYPDLPAPLNSLQEMEPGRGYWIRMDQAGTLTYPTQ